MSALAFDYEAKTWGGSLLRPRPWYIQGLKLRFALDALRQVQGRALDVGCGAGNAAKAIKRERPDLEVHGVDLSAAAVAAAEREPAGVSFRTGGAERLPYPDGFFEAVLMFDVLEHVPDVGAALRETARVLRPGGLFHVALPLEDQPWTLYRFLTRRGWRAKVNHCGHVHFFSARSFRQLTAQAGLPARRVRWSFHPFFQAVDVAYFSLLELRGPVRSSVEDYVARRRGPWGSLLKAGKGGLAALGWYESRALARLPGGVGHFDCRRSS